MGKWRGIFPLKSGDEIPFNFEITGKFPTDAKVYFINSEERYPGGKVVLKGDSLFIAIDQFDNLLVLGINKNHTLNGFFRERSGRGVPVNV